MHQAEPGRRVALADAARSLLALGPLQLGPGTGQVTHPQPDGSELSADVRQVTPGAKLLAKGPRLFERRDRGRVLAAEPGELGQLDEHGGRSPRLPQGPESSQGIPAIRLGPVHLAEHAAERPPQQRDRRPNPRILRGHIAIEDGEGAVRILLVQGQHRLAHRGDRMGWRGVRRPAVEIGHGRGQHGPDRVDLPGVTGGGVRADHPRLGHPGRLLARFERENLAGQYLRFTGLPAQHPVPAERPHEAQRGIGLLPRDRPAQRCVQVVLLDGQLTQPAPLPGGAETRIRGLGHVQVVRGERAPHRGFLPRLGQPLQTVGADGLQHPVARRQAVLPLGHAQYRLVDQAGQRGQHPGRG